MTHWKRSKTIPVPMVAHQAAIQLGGRGGKGGEKPGIYSPHNHYREDSPHFCQPPVYPNKGRKTKILGTSP